MFQKGELVIYGNSGVCVVEDIKTMSAADERLYYQLRPKFIQDNVIYIPVDNERVVMRKTMTKKEVLSLIDSMGDIDQMNQIDEKMREQEYKQALHSCDGAELVRLIKTSHDRREKRLQEGKKTTIVDDRYLKAAEDRLHEEFAVALSIDKEAVPDFIAKRLGGDQK